MRLGAGILLAGTRVTGDIILSLRRIGIRSSSRRIARRRRCNGFWIGGRRKDNGAQLHSYDRISQGPRLLINNTGSYR
jgi:hypothetical protein